MGIVVSLIAIKEQSKTVPWYIANRPEPVVYEVTINNDFGGSTPHNTEVDCDDYEYPYFPEFEFYRFNEDELDLIARCVEAEAGNQDLYGRQLVVDVILNRLESDEFPGTIEEVIYQKNQFAVVGNGMIDKAVPSELTHEAIALECEYRTNRDVLWFCSTGFLPYGEKWMKVGDHYFCINDGNF